MVSGPIGPPKSKLAMRAGGTFLRVGRHVLDENTVIYCLTRGHTHGSERIHLYHRLRDVQHQRLLMRHTDCELKSNPASSICFWRSVTPTLPVLDGSKWLVMLHKTFEID